LVIGTRILAILGQGGLVEFRLGRLVDFTLTAADDWIEAPTQDGVKGMLAAGRTQ
jgi:hypothetical protein